jgi:hypothetical protein
MLVRPMFTPSTSKSISDFYILVFLNSHIVSANDQMLPTTIHDNNDNELRDKRVIRYNDIDYKIQQPL